MSRFRTTALALVLLPALGAAPTAFAQDSAAPPVKKVKPAKTSTAAAAPAKERRPGELEGWDSGVKAPLVKKPKRPADVIGEKQLPDGGLPLPEVRTRDFGDAPVGFDKGGNVGGNFKF